MRMPSILLAAALLAAGLASPGLAAGNNGGASLGGWPGGSPGGHGAPGGAPPSHGPSGPGPSARGSDALTPHGPTLRNNDFKPPLPIWKPPVGVTGRTAGLSGGYVFDDNGYDDGSDPTGCLVYRKVHNRAGQFLGWAHVNRC